jgi:hypothetical protein
MAKNKLSLNDHLFEAMEWLGDRDIKGGSPCRGNIPGGSKVQGCAANFSQC